METFYKNSYTDILNSKPYLLYSQGDLIEGINLFSKLLENHPHDSNIWVELGFAHLKNLDFEMSFMCFETAYKINPQNSNVTCALGLFYYESNKFKLAKKFYKKTLEIDKTSEWGKLNLSMLEQTSGDYFKGLSLYEERDKERCLLLHQNYKENHLIEVTDLNLIDKKKNILIIGEQGFGDQLMACHYIARLQKLGFNITYLINEKLFDLIQNISGLEKVKIKKIITENDLKSFSYKVFSMSLPFLFYKSNINRTPLKLKKVNSVKNIRKYPQNIHRLIEEKKLKVGIAWSGRSSQTRNSFRSVRLEFFEKILSNKDISFFVLQKISNIDDYKIINQIDNLHNLDSFLEDFTDTAFFLSKMDFVVSVDTSLVHLSALLDVKTLLLLSKIYDPKWNEKNHGVLYKCVKKFKQKELNNWFHPLKEINDFLKTKTSLIDQK